MGIYLNPGMNSYKAATESEIFIDKTEMIGYVNSIINTNQKYLCVSRPRRFGKTIAANMLCAYYDRTIDSHPLFETKQISKLTNWDRYINQFDVIRLNMLDFLSDSEDIHDMMIWLKEELIEELMAYYPEVSYGSRKNLRIVMNRICGQTGRQFIILIDEWDAVFRKYPEKKEEHKTYLDFLRDWLKDKEYVALAYMTGILPIKKYGEHSALNMFREFSMISPLYFAPYTGFTEDEVMELCRKYGRPYDEVKEWYDGYVVTDIIPPDPDYKEQKESGKPLRPKKYSLYNPVSVVESVSSGIIKNYWNLTETYEALADYINKNYDGIKEFIAVLMDGGKKEIDITTFQNDMTTFYSKDDILTMLIHLGYLGYDSQTKEVFIPNKEVLDVFRSSTKSQEWAASFRALQIIPV